LLHFFNFCWAFQKFPFFCVILYISHGIQCEISGHIIQKLNKA
jgi:hypothetical protein